jgi:allantoate deiminase
LHLLAVARPRGDGDLIGLAAPADGLTIRPMHQRVTAKSDAYGTSLRRRRAELAALTGVPGQLTRRDLTPAHLAANAQIAACREAAGRGVRTVALLSVPGRYEGRRPNAPAIVLGSHLDTVLDAGRYDGALGVLAALAVAVALSRRGERLEPAVEVAAFGEQEGSRFPSHIRTACALIGAVDKDGLESRDRDGISMREALAAAGGDADAYVQCARKPGEIAAYRDLHIEQGPVLQRNGLGLAAVTASNGSQRLAVTVAGWPDMPARCGSPKAAMRSRPPARWSVRSSAWPPAKRPLVASVGRIAALPGAQNVSPGKVRCSIAMRCPANSVLARADCVVRAELGQIAARRGVHLAAPTDQNNAATQLAPEVISTVLEAIAACGHTLSLPSGAGRAAGIMARYCPGCKDGISHHPAEAIPVQDAAADVRALLAATGRRDHRPAGTRAA